MENTAFWIAIIAVFVAILPVVARGMGKRDERPKKKDDGGTSYTAASDGDGRKPDIDDSGASGGWGSDGGGGDGGGGD